MHTQSYNIDTPGKTKRLCVRLQLKHSAHRVAMTLARHQWSCHFKSACRFFKEILWISPLKTIKSVYTNTGIVYLFIVNVSCVLIAWSVFVCSWTMMAMVKSSFNLKLKTIQHDVCVHIRSAGPHPHNSFPLLKLWANNNSNHGTDDTKICTCSLWPVLLCHWWWSAS